MTRRKSTQRKLLREAEWWLTRSPHLLGHDYVGKQAALELIRRAGK